jgi:hypothetical protein
LKKVQEKVIEVVKKQTNYNSDLLGQVQFGLAATTATTLGLHIVCSAVVIRPNRCLFGIVAKR